MSETLPQSEADAGTDGPITQFATGLAPDMAEPIVKPAAEVADTVWARAKRAGGIAVDAAVAMARVALTGDH